MDARTVGAVAELTGVPVRTLHHYHHIGLVVPSVRTAAEYRGYTDSDSNDCTSCWGTGPPACRSMRSACCSTSPASTSSTDSSTNSLCCGSVQMSCRTTSEPWRNSWQPIVEVFSSAPRNRSRSSGPHTDVNVHHNTVTRILEAWTEYAPVYWEAERVGELAPA